MTALEIKEMTLKTIKSKIKSKKEPGITAFGDRDQCGSRVLQAVKQCAIANNCKLTLDDETFLTVSRSYSAFICMNWMQRYFQLTGDEMPNTNGEIHLEACDYKDLYAEYIFDMDNIYKEDVKLSYSAWRRIWKKHFAHVRVREYKQVTGKCDTCELLSEKRKAIKTSWGRQLVTECHAFHR